MWLAASLIVSLQPYLGVSNSDLNWNISQDLSGTASPNILSELEFDGVRGYHAGLAGSVGAELFRPDLFVFVEGDRESGRVQAGRTVDTDYLADNRSQIGSQSAAEIGGDDRSAYSAGLGLSYIAGERQGFSVIVGGYQREQDLNFRRGRQLVASPELFPVSSIDALTRNLQQRLNSNYLAEWSGYWMAGEYHYRWQFWTVKLRYQRYRGDYYGEGRWNLRADGPFALQQPRSFAHEADSVGTTWQLALEQDLSDEVAFELRLTKGRWDTGAGSARVFFKSGSIGQTRLNQAAQRVSQVDLALTYSFQ